MSAWPPANSFVPMKSLRTKPLPAERHLAGAGRGVARDEPVERRRRRAVGRADAADRAGRLHVDVPQGVNRVGRERVGELAVARCFPARRRSSSAPSESQRANPASVPALPRQ